MSEYITIARPYAKAIFYMAKEDETLEDWQNFLKFVADIMDDSSIISYMKNRTISHSDKSGMIINILDSNLTLEKTGKKFINFINVLSYYGRFLCVKDIHVLYKHYMNIELGCVDAIVKVPCLIDSYQKDNIINSLAKRFDKKVSALFEVEENLLGGFWVKTGDFVLDASIVGNLKSLSIKIML